jgi:peptidoglycan hydrolase CwlO-like protein
MADPLSVAASVVAVVTAAIQSTKALSAAVKRYKDRDQTLNRLQHELEDLTNILSSLEEVIDSDKSMSTLLEGPVHRCSQVCREFKDAMEKFNGKTKTGLKDWARMEFMRGDIRDFMDTLASYKSTIMVGLGTITMSVTCLSLLKASANHPRGTTPNSVLKSLKATVR